MIKLVRHRRLDAPYKLQTDYCTTRHYASLAVSSTSLRDLLGVDPLGLGGEGRDDPVREDWSGDLVHVLEPDHIAAQQRRPRFGAQNQVLHGARPGAPRNQRLQPRGGSRVVGRVFRTNRAA